MSSKTRDSLPFSTHTSFYKQSSKANTLRNTILLTPSYRTTLNSSKIKNHLQNLNKSLNTENYSENGYINRPTITFKPKMPLYNLQKEDLINPSKMNYVVSINPPPSHRIQRGFGSVNNRNKKSNFSFSFLKPDLKNEIEEYEKGLLTSYRRINLQKKNNLY
jgi:hypothetical protein